MNSREEYNIAMQTIEKLLQKSTETGFDSLTKEEENTLQKLSLEVEKYEDSLPLMPIKAPSSLAEMIRLKMFEMNLRQKQLATMLGISEARISEVLTGKRKVNIELAKKLYNKLNIDPKFILEFA